MDEGDTETFFRYALSEFTKELFYLTYIYGNVIITTQLNIVNHLLYYSKHLFKTTANPADKRGAIFSSEVFSVGAAFFELGWPFLDDTGCLKKANPTEKRGRKAWSLNPDGI